MKNLLTLILVISIKVAFAQSSGIKIVSWGEHLGYSFESFTNQHSDTSSIQQGETWSAVYVSLNRDNFKTKKEVIRWDSLQNFTIESDTVVQPLFYIQGLKTINSEGSCRMFNLVNINNFELPIWNVNNSYYFLSYTDINKNINAQKYDIISDRNLTLYKSSEKNCFKNINLDDKDIVHLEWTGDINSDQEPDFLIYYTPHHETLVIELILSKKKKNRVSWERVARFTTWS